MASEHPGAGVDYPRNWHELLDWFPDDGACLRYLERLRWGDGFACRFCGTASGGWWQMADGLRRCAVCRSETSVTAGTIFAGTRTPLVSWFAAVWYVVNQKQGVSALGLQRVLGLGSYQTAWAWLHKLRRAMVRPGRDALEGIVEVDETLVGGVKPGKRGRGADGKALVAVGVEVYESGPGRDDAPHLRRVGRHPDRVRARSRRPRRRGPHRRVGRLQRHRPLPLPARRHEHLRLRRPAHVVMPEVHRVASLLKRWLLGTHQGAVSHDQLDYYLDEFTFRFNRRRSRHRGLLFYRLLEGAVATAPHPYNGLTSESAT